MTGLHWLLLLSLSLAGQVGLWHASPDRCGIARLRRHPAGIRLLRLLALGSLVLLLVWMAALIGWETGIPIWLGVQMAAGLAGLYLGARNPDLRDRIAAAACIVALLTIALLTTVPGAPAATVGV